MRTISIQRLAVLCLLYPLLNACEDDPDVFIPPEPGEALIYAYPSDGMVDLPLGSKLLLTFSSAIDEAAAKAECQPDGENFAGALCLADSEGNLVDLSSAQVSNRNHTFTFSMSGLRPGEEYRLWVSPQIASGIVNLDDQDGPLITFRTRQYHPLPDQVPEVLAINQENPGAYLPEPVAEERFPFMDFSPVRITFTEPLVETTVRYGDTVKLEHQQSGELVDVRILNERHYITLDPKEDLIGGDTYTLTLQGLEDFDEDVLETVTYELTPTLSKDDVVDLNPPIKQLMKAQPALGDPGYPQASRLHGLPLNQFNLVTEALGVTQVNAMPLVLEGWMGRPDVHVDAVPVVARAGQQLRITGIDPIKLGGEVRTPMFTGDIIGTFVTDVTGYLVTNPYRPKGFQPDDDYAPMFVYMNFDLAMHAVEPRGNASVNQNLMHIQAVGVVDVKDGALTFEVFRTLELDILSGAAKVSADFALGVRADVDFEFDQFNRDPLQATGSFPEHNQTQVEPSNNIVVVFNEPVHDEGMEQVKLFRQDSSEPVPVQVRSSGSNLVITPLNALAAGQRYYLDLGDGLKDQDLFDPSHLQFVPGDATDGTGQIVFDTASYAADNGAPVLPPVVLGAYPGIGCALEDRGVERQDADGNTVQMAGRCVGGLASDSLYYPFFYDVSRPIEISFNMPMEMASMTFGTIAADGQSCEGGAMCLGEQVNGQWQNIPMSARRNSLRLRAQPAPDTITPGNAYRLVINGGDSGEAVFRSHDRFGNLGINTDPLNGMGTCGPLSNQPCVGGPPILLDFTATPDEGAAYATVLTREYTDVNGNGNWDNDEVEAVNNHARGHVKSTGGLIGGANLDQGDQIFTHAALPMAFLPKQPLDLSYIGLVDEGDGRWCATQEDADGEIFCIQTVGESAIPVEINAQHVMGTSLTANATLAIPILGDLIPLPLETGALVLRFRPYDDKPPQPLRGFVVNQIDPDTGEEIDDPIFITRLDAWLDAPDLRLLSALIPGGQAIPNVADANVRSLPVSAYLTGPVKFLRNGQITLESRNASAIAATLNLSVDLGALIPVLGDLLDLIIGGILPEEGVGSLELGIAKDDFRIRVVNNPTHARLTTAGQENAGER